MVARPNFVAFVFAVLALLIAGQSYAQDELRKTFFKDADAALAAAEAVDAALLAPRAFERGQKEYDDAETALQRGTSRPSAPTLLMRHGTSGKPPQRRPLRRPSLPRS